MWQEIPSVWKKVLHDQGGGLLATTISKTSLRLVSILCGKCYVFSIAEVCSWRRNMSVFLQLVANLMLYFAAVLVGVMAYFMADRKYRTAFLEAKQSLEVSLTLKEQSQQQVHTPQTHSEGMRGFT